MTETPEQRARRLGLIKETPDERAKRLGLTARSLDVAAPAELSDTTAGGSVEPEEESPGYGGRFVRSVLNAAGGIPGMDAVMAGAGVVGSKFTDNPMSYEESYDTLKRETGRINPVGRAVGKAAGAVATLPFLPANPAIAGAVFGGADQALDANPRESLEARLLQTGAGTALGAGVGYAGDLAVSGGRALLAKPTAKVLDDLVAAKTVKADKLYGKAIAEGQGKTTPAIQNFLHKSDIQDIARELKQTREFANAADDSPEMLDAIYKVLSDRAALAKRQADAVTPNKPNIGRFRRKDIKAAQEEALDAMSGGVSLPGPMPTYRTAVKEFAKDSRLEDAVMKGHDVVRSAQNKNVVAAKSLKNIGPEAFQKWLAKASPEELEMAVKGALGSTKEAWRKAPIYSIRKTQGLDATLALPSILRKINTPKQQLLDDLIKGSLTSGQAQF